MIQVNRLLDKYLLIISIIKLSYKFNDFYDFVLIKIRLREYIAIIVKRLISHFLHAIIAKGKVKSKLVNLVI